MGSKNNNNKNSAKEELKVRDEKRLRKRRNVNYIVEEAPLAAKDIEKPLPEIKVEEPVEPEEQKDENKKVVCLDTGEVYVNAKEANKETGANASSIIRCCNGNCKTAGKLRWAYYEG